MLNKHSFSTQDYYLELRKHIQMHNIPEEMPSFIELYPIVDVFKNKIKRENFTKHKIFTIDSDTTQDMDDAIELVKHNDGGYMLGVHIADVGSYIAQSSLLDIEAKNRGLSLYLPHKTIPMLPKILSDDLCSIKPNVQRLATSILINLDKNGTVLNYKILKSVIESKIKGTYDEVNAILNSTAPFDIKNRYLGFTEVLYEMSVLANILHERRRQAGANMIASDNSKYILSKDGIVSRLLEEHGIAGRIVEEFMVLANHLIADFFEKNHLPLIYRIQEKAGQNARYSTSKLGHVELATNVYAHFTSPIRRLADLKLHQILTAYLSGVHLSSIRDRFQEDIEECAELATRRANRASELYYRCNQYCSNLYLQSLGDKEFQAFVKGRNYNGFSLFYLPELKITLQGVPNKLIGSNVKVKIHYNATRKKMEVIQAYLG